MRFVHPELLWFVPLIAAVSGGLWWLSRRGALRRITAFTASVAAKDAWQQGQKARGWHWIGITVALIALGLALARPLAGTTDQQKSGLGVNVLIALDGSASMRAEDIDGGRLAAAKAGIVQLLRRLEGDRAGLLFFGGQTTLVAPLTYDTVSLELLTQHLEVEWVGKGGSSLAGVIERAREYFGTRPFQSKILVIFSDGEETEGDAILAAQDAYRRDGLRVFTVGAGTIAGAPIPAFERDPRNQWVRAGTVHDAQQQEMISKLEEAGLTQMAAAAGGTYANLQAVQNDWGSWYEHQLKPLAGPLGEVALKDDTELFAWPLALAIISMGLARIRRTAMRARDERRDVVTPAGIRDRKKATTTATVFGGAMVLALLAGGSPRLDAATESAQAMLRDGQTAAAFQQLQQQLLAAPDESVARYNYGIGAYAAGKYEVAIPVFEALAESGEPDIAARSRFQLGNSYYRAGEAMRPAQLDAAIALWEKALGAFEQGQVMTAARANWQKTQGDLLDLLREAATQRIAAGDEAARLSAIDGIPAWREALGYLGKGLKFSENPAQAELWEDTREAVEQRIYQAHYQRATDRQRRAEMQRANALENAIDLMADAVDDYTAALAVKPHSPDAQTGLNEASAVLVPWRVELADRLHAKGVEAKAISLADALVIWQQAAGHYTRALGLAPTDAAALAGQRRNNHALHDGHVEAGDYKQARAQAANLAPEDRDSLLDQALNHYQTAAGLEPENAATQAKLMELGRKLADRFAERGAQELALGKAVMAEKIAEAIMAVERAVQSFDQALRFEPEHAAALAGKAEAEALLKKLRALDAEQQRRVLGDGKEMKDAKEMEDPGELALKLLDFDNDKLTSKKQQNLSAPENMPVKNW